MKLPKIMSEEEKQRKDKRNKRLMTFIIVAILMASTAAFALTFDSSEQEKYNGFKFIRTDNGWQMKDTELLTIFLPGEVENVTSEKINPEDFQNNIYYLAVTNSEQRAANEINRAFYNFIEKAQLACSEKYSNETFCAEMPIKNCENETSDLIIEIEESENQSMSYIGNCISIKGNEMDLLKIADKLIFSSYGIIE